MSIKLKYLFFRCLLSQLALLAATSSIAQTDSTSTNFGGIIYMDSLVVTASRTGFVVSDFIKMVQTDSSFYQAFHNIRFLSYESDNDIRFYNKKGKETARLDKRIKQNIDDDCRTMDVLSEKATGNYYKRNKKRRYYTAKMYEKIFFTFGKICENEQDYSKSNSGIEKHVEDLKVLIFQPGTEVDVPIVGKKTRIFNKALLPYYDYAIESKKYKSKTNCYVFSAKVKEAYKNKKEDKTIIKSLETFFDKSTFAVVARNYHLYYRSPIVDFDVRINIELTKNGDQYLPEFLHFDGFWNIPFKSAERSWFETSFFY